MLGLWIVIAVIVGLAVGGGLGFLVAERRSGKAAADAGRREAELSAHLQAATRDADKRSAEVVEVRRVADALRERLSERERDAERLSTQLAAERDNLAEQKRLLTQAEAKFKDVFAGVGGEALDRNTAKFMDLAGQRFETLTKQAEGDLGRRQEQIETMLAPMRVLLDKYQTRLKEVEDRRGQDREHLSNLLATLQQSHARLDAQTGQLVTALSKQNTRGRWGEIQLERIAELAGMTRNVDFETQVSVDGADGNGRLRPDMIVRLPDNRRIIVDAKVPWDHFQAGCAETDGERRTACFAEYAKSVRGHCQALSARGYQDQFEGTLEFVVMFMPGEAFLYAAVESQPSLIEDALKNKVVIATPTTLIALLKAVEFGWRQQRAAENAAEIQKLGEDLHKRIGVFVGHFAKLGKGLDAAAGAYNAAMVSLERNLLLASERLEEKGIDSGKEVARPDGIDLRLNGLGDRATAAVARATE